MTPEERAANCGVSFQLSCFAPPAALQSVRDEIATAIRDAVAEAREACAVICERVYAENRRMGLTQRPCSDEAAAIRAQHLFE